MRSFPKKDSYTKLREQALKKNLYKRKLIKKNKDKRNVSTVR